MHDMEKESEGDCVDDGDFFSSEYLAWKQGSRQAWMHEIGVLRSPWMDGVSGWIYIYRERERGQFEVHHMWMGRFDSYYKESKAG